SRKTPEFRKQIKEDFLKFDEIYSKGATGNSSLAFGWLLEEQEHDENKGEKASCFFVIRGWESMDHFEQSVKHDAYKEAIPLLFAWNAPWKMNLYSKYKWFTVLSLPDSTVGTRGDVMQVSMLRQ
ncbi:hypothetical protein DH86_00003757, partial [Scytalidium sp. 3C]